VLNPSFKRVLNKFYELEMQRGHVAFFYNYKDIKKLIVIPTTNLLLTLKSNTMKNSMQN